MTSGAAPLVWNFFWSSEPTTQISAPFRRLLGRGQRLAAEELAVEEPVEGVLDSSPSGLRIDRFTAIEKFATGVPLRGTGARCPSPAARSGP